ncbi:hypothetical protein ACOMHN_066667 [Nucella lapillus]
MMLGVFVVVWLAVFNTVTAGHTAPTASTHPAAGSTLLQSMKQMLATLQQGMNRLLTQKPQSSSGVGTSGSSTELLAIKNKLMVLEAKLETTQAIQRETRTKLEATQTKQEATQTKLEATQTKLEATQTKLEATQTLLEANQRETRTKLEATQTKFEASEAIQKEMRTKLEASEAIQRETRTKLERTVAKQATTQATLKTLKSKRKSGSTFIRWGRKTCNNASHLVYSGVAGGSWWDHPGAAANPLCLTLTPQFDTTRAHPTRYALLYGAEYEAFHNRDDHDVPCSVCRVPQSTTIMIPATRACPKGWTTQYAGHLSAGREVHKAASQYVCMDGDPEIASSGHRDDDGYVFYYTLTRCGSLPCPPYVHNKVVLCVVCSK